MEHFQNINKIWSSGKNIKISKGKVSLCYPKSIITFTMKNKNCPLARIFQIKKFQGFLNSFKDKSFTTNNLLKK